MILKRRSSGKIGLNLTSMIDVVFLLLIYFMVATEFKSAEEAFPMDLPVRNAGRTVTLDSEPLIILVDSAGEGAFDVQVRLDGPWDSLQSLEELSYFLRTNKASGFGSQGLFTESHPILVKPAKQTRWEHAIATYNVVVNAKYSNITLDEPS